MKLSILICHLPGPYRDRNITNELIDNIVIQCDEINAYKPNSCEVIYFGDNKSMSVGRKRNILLDIAQGERVCFVDDDDKVSDDYVKKMLSYFVHDVDCVAIGVRYTQDGSNEKIYDYSYKKNINTRLSGVKTPVAGRMPNHLCLWKKQAAKRVRFPDRNLGEDHEWAEKQLFTNYSLHIEKEIIYNYRFERQKTQTRLRK